MIYIKLFLDYLDVVEPLGDAERGRLFTALLEYARTGEAPRLSGNERFLFPMMRAQIDRDSGEYRAYCEKQAENGKKGGRPPKEAKRTANPEKPAEPKKPTAFSKTQKSQDKDKEEDEDKEEDKDGLPLPPAAQACGFGPELAAAFSDWLQYKQERREEYKPMGLRALAAQVRKQAEAHGEAAVAELIRQCMASNWQGIIFDRLNQPQCGRAPGRNMPGKGAQERGEGDKGWMKKYIQQRGKEGGA